MSVVIAFSPGTYGTYLEWCLATLTSKSEILSPFTLLGSSHVFRGNHLLNIQGLRQCSQSNKNYQIARLHPKTLKDESLSDNLDAICNEADYVIHMYPSEDTQLLCLNNFLSKVWANGWWENQFESEIDKNKIFQNWAIPSGTDINHTPQWVKREFLSFYLMPAWHAQIEWYHPAKWSNSKCLVIPVNLLLYSFEQTLTTIQNYCNLLPVREISELLPFHQKNIELQNYRTHDQLCKDIVECTINNRDLQWDELSLCSESWIQWELRNQGFEIRCDGLDIFPTNSVQLRELLYPV